MLEEIARKRPRTMPDLMDIKGMGKKRSNKFGAAFLNIVVLHERQEGAARDGSSTSDAPEDGEGKLVAADCRANCQTAASDAHRRDFYGTEDESGDTNPRIGMWTTRMQSLRAPSAASTPIRMGGTRRSPVSINQF